MATPPDSPATRDEDPPAGDLRPGQRVGPGEVLAVDAARIARFAAALHQPGRSSTGAESKAASGAEPEPEPPAVSAPATFVIALALDSPGGPVDLIAPLVSAGVVVGVVQAEQQLRVHRPVRAGDRLVFSSVVRTVRERAGATIASIATEVRDDRDGPVAELDATFFLTGRLSGTTA